VSERSKNLTRRSSDSTQNLAVLTDCQVQHLHNLQYTCTIIVENRNGEVTDCINNSFPLDFDFGAIDQTNELKHSFKFCVFPPRFQFDRSSLLRSLYIDLYIDLYISYGIFLVILLRIAKQRSDSFSTELRSHLKKFFFSHIKPIAYHF